MEPRRCTDVWCCGVHVFCFLCLCCLSGWAFEGGFPGQLTHGGDVHGNVCGYGKFTDKEYTYFLAPTSDIEATICLPGCPAFQSTELLRLYGPTGSPYNNNTGCVDAYPSKPFFNKYCLPALQPLRTSVLTYLYSRDKVMSRVVGDLARAWDILAVMLTITGVSVLVYIFVLSAVWWHYQPINVLFYGLNVVLLLFLFATVCFLLYAEHWRVQGKLCADFGPVHMVNCDESSASLGYTYLCWACAAVFFLLICSFPVLFYRLLPGLKALKAAASLTQNDPGLILSFFLIVAICTGLLAFYITLLVYTVSTGAYEDKAISVAVYSTARVWGPYTAPRVLVFFEVGMVLWQFSFFAHCLEFLAGTYATCRFFEEEGVLAPLKKGMWNLCRYHLGSVALAAVLVPCWRFPRDSTLCLSYSSSDALAYQALTGDSFFVAAGKAGKLLEKYRLLRCRNKLNNGSSVLWLYQITIMLIAPALTGYWVHHKTYSFQDTYNKEITSVVAMMAYSLVFSWFLALLFACLYRGLLHGGVLCHVFDMERNEGKSRHSTPKFRALLYDREEDQLSSLEVSQYSQRHHLVSDEDLPMGKWDGDRNPDVQQPPTPIANQKEESLEQASPPSFPFQQPASPSESEGNVHIIGPLGVVVSLSAEVPNSDVIVDSPSLRDQRYQPRMST